MNIRNTVLLALMAILAISCGSSSSLPAVETDAQLEWEYPLSYYTSTNVPLSSLALLSEDGESIAFISPRGFEAIDANGGGQRISGDRSSWYSGAVGIETSRGTESIPSDKVSFIYVPHLNSVLEFNFGRASETVTLIDMDTGTAVWENVDLRWSLERYGTAARALARNLGGLRGAAVGEAASATVFAPVFINNITNLIPELNALAIKTFDGLTLIDLDTGEPRWTTDGLQGQVAAFMYDERSNSLVFVNDDSISLHGVQLNRQIARVDAETGEMVWESAYHGNIREKVNGFGDWQEDLELDIRLAGDFLIINFVNLEVYSMDTGERLWRTSTSGDRLLDLIAPEAQAMNFFAFPVSDGETIYRVKHGNVGLTGFDVEMEAFNLATGERLWETGRLGRNNIINSIVIHDNLLLTSFDGNGSNEGIKALDRQTGETVWQVEVGRRGVTQPLQIVGNQVWVVNRNNVRILDISSGEQVHQFTAAENAGNIQDLYNVNGNIFMLGDAGLVVYDLQTGEKRSITEASRTSRLYPTGNRVVSKSLPADMSSPVHVFDAQGNKLSSLAGSSSRSHLLISHDGSALFEIVEGVVRKYRVN